MPQVVALAEEVAGTQRSAAQQTEPDVQARLAAALAMRRCAHLGCTNLWGCSEGRLPTRLCSGCRLVRYCSLDCAAAARGQHAAVCRRVEPARQASVHAAGWGCCLS